MKKFMKAIAFATVMCMLLSVAAFAANEPDYTIADGGTISVTVTDANAANQQIAFVAANSEITSAANLATANILDVQQVAFNGSGVAEVILNVGTATAASVFYGYQSNPEDEAVFKTAGVAAAGATIQIIAKEIYDNDDLTKYTSTNEGFELPVTDTDNAGAIKATVLLTNPANKTVDGVIWSIRYTNANGEADVAYVTSTLGLGVLDGETEIGLAFSNGNRSEGDAAIAEVEVTDLHAIVILKDAENVEEIIYSDATNFDSSRKESK